MSKGEGTLSLAARNFKRPRGANARFNPRLRIAEASNGRVNNG